MPFMKSKGVDASEKKADDVSRMGKTQIGLKKTVGLSKSGKQLDSRDSKEQSPRSKSRATMEDSREEVEQQIRRKIASKPPRPSRSGRSFEPMATTIQEDEEEGAYDHGVVDVWLQQNASRAMSPTRRRRTKSKKTFKPSGDTSVITETTLKAGNFLSWELGN
mmetsp:Transcript_18931/g.54557  ORF Transcript_18931/g.54557 Transcript_18931/m.54557 type:complete len:163 (+) Transcript_18931:179-667(+)